MASELKLKTMNEYDGNKGPQIRGTAGSAHKAAERPIIMSGDNPKLILEERKTQTRRIVEKQPSGAKYYVQENDTFINGNPNAGIERKGGRWAFYKKPTGFWGIHFSCPYGVAGDRLWVRETFLRRRDCGTMYRATTPMDDTAWQWKSPLFMRREWSRIALEITKVRVERLQDISAEDCVAEGRKMPGVGLSADIHIIRSNFASRWDSLHGKGAWDKNPWVWVIEFRRVCERLGT